MKPSSLTVVPAFFAVLVAHTVAAVEHPIVIRQAAFNQPPTLEAPAGSSSRVQIDPPPNPPAEEIPARKERAGRRGYRHITTVAVDAALPPGLLPEQAGRQQGKIEPTAAMPEIGDPRLVHGWGDNIYQWSATALCHGPLYFEEVNLERYGYQCHAAVQPFVSGAHFFLTVPTLPYQMTVHPPRECIYTLGHYRPGSRVPWQRHRLPWDARAAAVQAGVTVGLVFLIP